MKKLYLSVALLSAYALAARCNEACVMPCAQDESVVCECTPESCAVKTCTVEASGPATEKKALVEAPTQEDTLSQVRALFFEQFPELASWYEAASTDEQAQFDVLLLNVVNTNASLYQTYAVVYADLFKALTELTGFSQWAATFSFVMQAPEEA